MFILTVLKYMESSSMIDTLSIKSKYSKRLQRLMADPTTPSKVAFYSSVIPGLGHI